MKRKIDLLPCPFCAHIPQVLRHRNIFWPFGKHDTYELGCIKYNHSVRVSGSTKCEVTEAWNHRQ